MRQWYMVIVGLFILAFTGCTQRTLIVDTTYQGDEGTWNTQEQGERWTEEVNHSVSSWDDTNQSGGGFLKGIEVAPPKSQGLVRIPFPTEEYSILPKSGTGTIKGKIYLQGIYGDRAIGKKTRLYLNPVTSYSNQWYEESYLGGIKMEKADARLYNYLRFTSSDSKGNFAFYGVPRGEYYLIGTVKCRTECGYTKTKTVRVAKRVSVYGNVVQQDLTRVMEVP
jgi:hypothetical protein